MFNSLSIIGRLTADPEQFISKNGIAFTKFSIAHNKDFSKNEETYFFDAVAWKSTAVFIMNHFKKGQLILISGKLAANTWIDKNGLKHNDTQIEVDSVYFYGTKQEEQSDPSNQVVTDTFPHETTDEQKLPYEKDKPQNSEKRASHFNRTALENYYKPESEDEAYV